MIVGISHGPVSCPKPTRPDDTLAVTSETEEITPSRSCPDRGTLKVRSETRNQRDEIVQVPSRQADCGASRCKAIAARG
jgi:acyl dehydratase